MPFFNSFTRSVLPLSCLAILAGCVPVSTTAPVAQVPISSDFRAAPIQSDDVGPNSQVFLKVRDSYGYVEVCGAIVTSNASSRSEIERNVRNKYFVRMDDDLILNNLNLLAVVAPPQTPQNAQANCIATDILWRPVYNSSTPELIRRPS